MNYIGLINNLKEVALELNTVNSFYDGDVYNNWNNQEVRYGSINVGLESTTRTDNTVIYNVVIYYADRLLQDKSNKNGIWTDATNTITSIINGIDNSITYEGPLNITPFEQKFADYLAGGYSRVGLEVNFDLGDCDLDESQYIVPAIFITRNGVYNVTDYEIADVNIPVPSLTELDVTENGTYIAENYDGYSKVNVNVPAEKPETTLTQTITTNGTQTFNPPTGYVFDKAVITTDIKTWAEEYNQALTTITELRQQVSQDTQTIANLNAQINNLNAQILLKERTISELQATITQKDAQIAAKDATIQALQNQISELTAERNRLLSVISDLNDTIADKNATIARLNKMIASVGSIKITNNGVYHPSGNQLGWNEVEVEVSAQKPEVDLVETVTTNDTYTYNPPEGYAFRSATFTVNIKTWEEEYNQALQTISELQATITEKDATISDLNSQITSLNNQIIQKDLQIRNLQDEIATKDATIASQAQQISSLNSQIESLQADIASLNNTIAEKNQEIQSLNSQISSLNTTILQQQVQIAQLQRQIDSVTTLNVNQNGTYTPPSGVLGWNEVNITVPEEKPEEHLRETITENRTYTYTPTQGSVFSDAHIEVNVQPALQDKEVTTNGDVNADAGYYGLRTVTVAVPEEKPEERLIETINDNGTINYNPTTGHVFSDAEITVNVQPPLQTKAVTVNGTVTPDSNYYGLSSVDVRVPERKPEEVLTETIGTNAGQPQTFNPTPGSVFSSASITVDVSNELETESVTSASGNGQTYTPSSGNIGFSSFEVNIPEESLTETVGSGTHHYEPTTGALINSVDITVDVSSELQSKTTTDYNTTVYPDQDKLGLSSVRVNVPTESLQPQTITQNGTTTYTPTSGSLFSGAIIEVDVQPELQDKTITINGIYTADSPYYGLDEVTVNVQPELQDKSITTNGIYTADQGYYGLNRVNVNVQPSLQSKSTTSNGRVSPDQGYYGLSYVDVAVPEVKPEETLTQTITQNGTTTYTPTTGHVFDSAEITVNVQPPLQSKSVTTPTATVTPDTGYYGLSRVDVAVPLTTKTVTANDTYNAADEGYAGYSSVTVNVPAPNLQNITVTEDGTYTAGQGYDGLGTVIVDCDYETVELTQAEYDALAVKDPHTYYAITDAVGQSLIPATITNNGTFTYTPTGNYKFLSDVEVTVAVPEEKEEDILNGTITATGATTTQTFNPTTGHVFSQANITVNVPLAEKTTSGVGKITSNGTYNASTDNVLGYSQVEVDVQPSLQSKTTTSYDTTVTPDQGYYGLSSVTVDVPTDTLTQTVTGYNQTYTFSPTAGHLFDEANITVNVPRESLNKTGANSITANGQYNFTPTSGSLYSDATINVNVDPNVGSKSITQNGTYNASTDNLNGYSTVTVTVPEEKPEEHLIETITTNGIHNYNPTLGSVFDSASITVAVSPNVGSKSITQNGTYNASTDSLDGYSTVTVSCPEPKPEVTLDKTGANKITANGTYNYTPTTGYVYDEANITVDVQPTVGTLTATNNNTTYRASDSNLDGFSEVTVQVPVPTLTTLQANTNTTYTAQSGTGWDEVVVNVPVPTLTTLQATNNTTYTATSGNAWNEVIVSVPVNTVAAKSTTITQNGTYVAQTTDSIDGYSQVTVNVPSIGYLEMTQAQYDALQVKDPNTIYLITD